MKIKLNQLALLLFLSVLAIKAWFGWAFLLDIPGVSPDEAIYADIVGNFLETGRFSSNLWAGMIPGIETAALWNPPSYFLSLAFWIQMFGEGIMPMRRLSLGLSLLVVVGAFLLLKKSLIKKTTQAQHIALGILGLGLVTDYFFQRASHIARPEIFVLCCLVWTLVVLKHKINRQSLIIAGVLSSLAVLAHPLAIIFVAGMGYEIARSSSKQWKQNLLVFCLSFSVLPTLWLISIFDQLDLLLTQLSLASQRKQADIPWLWLASRTQVPMLTVAFSVMQAGSAYVLYLAAKKYSWKNLPIEIIFLGLSWFLFISGRMMWYGVYPAFFFILSISSLYLSQKKYAAQIKLIALAFLAPLLINTYQQTSEIGPNSNYYYEFAYVLNEVLRPNSKIFIMSEPDPYFVLNQSQKNFELVEFPVLHMELQSYENILNGVDYVIFTGNLNQVVFGDFLDRYLEKNTAFTYKPNDGNYGYQAYVLELVSQSERQTVLDSENEFVTLETK